MRRTLRRASRVLSKAKAQRFSLSVTVVAVQVPPALIFDAPATRVFVELERGRHKKDSCSKGDAAAASSRTWATDIAPMSIPITLYKDGKGVFRAKTFMLRLKEEKNPVGGHFGLID